MWAIIKFDKKKIQLLKEDFIKKTGEDFTFYRPKILINRYNKNKLLKKEVYLLGDYLFCFHKKFNNKLFINQLKYSRGLKYFLEGLKEFQFDVANFIQRCKTLEDQNGYLTKSLFELNLNGKYKFLSGPFVDKIFRIISLRKNDIKILMGNLNTTINKKEFLFSPIK
tara:strand:- start:692 stop:1192 length:501 start_codon:yes stop_codon:yes gene_type:complete